MLSVFDSFHIPTLDAGTLAFLLPALFLLVHLVPYILDPHGIRGYPGPFLAKFSDIWLGWVSSHGHRSEIVHEMHQKYGALLYQQV